MRNAAAHLQRNLPDFPISGSIICLEYRSTANKLQQNLLSLSHAYLLPISDLVKPHCSSSDVRVLSASFSVVRRLTSAWSSARLAIVAHLF
jgi:hypothetical protein